IDPIASRLPGKLLLYYYLGLFQPQAHNGMWIGRQAVALLAPLTAALCFAVVKTFTRSDKAGLCAILLYAVLPFALFFERMALSDPLTAVFTTALIWQSVLLAKCPTLNKAASAGLLLGLASLAKLSAL